MSSTDNTDKPSFTENDVVGDFVDAIDQDVVGSIGHGLWLRAYDWGVGGGADDEGWPFTVVRDGREFEVDIDVRVTELTPEVKARRAAEEVRIMAMLKARGVQG